MNIHEYQTKVLFKNYGIKIPRGAIAYTPNEAVKGAKKVSEKGPWVVKAQIHSGSRDGGKFFDRRAGRKGGIRLSKTIDEVFSNAESMLENLLITNQTGNKGRLVSRVYVEEYIKTIKKFYISLVVDWTSASVFLLAIPLIEKNEDSKSLLLDKKSKILKLNLGTQKEINDNQLNVLVDYLGDFITKKELKQFVNKLLKLFYDYDATLIELNPIGINKKGEIWALDAKMTFDPKALKKHSDIVSLLDEAEIDERELTASRYGFQYKELNSGIGLIVNGDGLAINMINEAQKLDIDTACFLNLKGGVDRDKIAASIKLIMTNPKVDGIFINILGGFLRCNLIADGIIAVANDLGLNIPLVVRFEGTNKNDATDILVNSNLPLKIASDTASGLIMLKKAIEEDL